MTEALHVIVAPDPDAARILRRRVAERRGGLGVLVTTLGGAVDLARSERLLPDIDDTWSTQLKARIGSNPEAFWADSLEVASDATRDAVGRSLAGLLEATEPGVGALPEIKKLPPRIAQRYEHLRALHAAMGGCLPPKLARMRGLMAPEAPPPLRRMILYSALERDPSSRWDLQLLGSLGEDVGRREDLERLIRDWRADGSPAPDETALGRIQRHLFSPEEGHGPLDESLCWIGVRDAVEQVEVVAELIDSLLDEGACAAAEIGLLLPNDAFVHGTVREVFGQAGIATSGLPAVGRTRDLGREAIHLALRCLQDPSPPMAQASLALLPLMPWDRDAADELADHAMGRYRLPGRVEGFTDDGNRMLGLLRRRPDSPRSLIGTLRAIVGLLRPEPTPAHVASADGTVAQVIDAMAGRQEIPWAELLERTSPASIDVGGETSTDQEGVAVFSESREPWRPVRHLFLLGFNEGHFPGGVSADPVFGAHGLNALAEAGLPVRTGADRREVGRRLLRRQLSAASETLTILVPAGDLSGGALYPSETLGTMARLCQERVEPEALIRSIDRDEEISGLRGLSVLPPQACVPPRPLVVEEPHLDRDLTRLRLDAEGRPKPESPSGLEKLLVSPLGWFLTRAGLEPATWSPPGFDVMLQGKLAHKVFEDLFTPGVPIPDDRDLLDRVPEILKNALGRQARHLDPNEVWMEFDNLEGTLKRAVKSWAAFLRTTGAQVLCNESWMHGTLGDLPIRGLADTALCIDGDQILVVDFKKASVSKRKAQLERGFDLQASLYRIMVTAGHLADLPEELVLLVWSRCPTGVAYFTLNDGRAVAAHLPAESFADADVDVVPGDPARESMPLLFERLRQVREGHIGFNRDGDEKWFNEQASITPYALDTSPLVRLYTLPDGWQV